MIWKLLRLPLVPLALLCVAVMRLVYPWLHIRCGNFISHRIGHLIGNTSVYLAERRAGMHKSIDLFAHHGEICNATAAKLVSRALLVDPTRFLLLVILCNKLFQGWQRHDVGAGNWDRDVTNSQEKYPPQFNFSAKEEAFGLNESRKMGIPAGAKWVCLIVRDDAYLPDLRHHGHRDSDIDSYAEAVYALAERGYYVIRMGAKVRKSLPVLHSRVIDYAWSGQRTDFMDVWLMARCAFCVSNGTGLDAVSVAFKRPICYVNYAPLGYLQTYNPRSLAIWKHHWKDGKRMGYEEIFKSGVFEAPFADVFKAEGVELRDNTAGEILDVVLEMADRDDGSFDFSYTFQNEVFWRSYPRKDSAFTNRPMHGEIRMRIGREFLRDYENNRGEREQGRLRLA